MTVYKTTDGVPIVDGLRVWTNDLERGAVDFRDTSLIDSEYFDGWFAVRLDSGRRSLANGERMTTTWDGQPA